MEKKNNITDLVDNSENGFVSWADVDLVYLDLTDRGINIGFSITEFKEFAQNIAHTLQHIDSTADPMVGLHKTAECFKAVAINNQTLKDNSTEDQAYYEGEENAYAEIMYQIHDEAHHE